MTTTPDPTLLAPLSILKIWADGFGIQLNEEQRYEVTNIHTAYNRYKYLPQELVTDQLKGLVTESYQNALTQIIPATINDVIENVRETCFFAMTPKQIEDYVWGEIYAVAFAEALFFVHHNEKYLPSLLQMMKSDDSRHATSVALEHLDNDPTWREFKSTLDKAAIDKLWRWRTMELASLTTLKALLSSNKLSEESRQRFFTILLHARFLDSFKPKPKKEESEQGPSELLFASIRFRHLNRDLRLPLPQQVTHTEQEKEQCLWAYDLLKGWQRANQDFNKGDVKGACRRYTQLLKLSPTLKPAEQRGLIHCAMMVASMKDKNGDAPLLRKAKNLAIVYGFDPAHDHFDERDKDAYKQRNDFVKEYEVEELQRDCKRIFPKASVDYSRVRPIIPVAYYEETNFTAPARKSKIGDSDVALEQLSQAIQHRQYDQLVKLLKQTKNLRFGNYARGHTPLIIALQNYIRSRSEKDENTVFMLLEAYKTNALLHKAAIQTRTDRLKLTPLGLAIESNHPAFVEKLLELGASVNQRFSQHFCTPLEYAEHQLVLFGLSGDEVEATKAKTIVDNLARNQTGSP